MNDVIPKNKKDTFKRTMDKNENIDSTFENPFLTRYERTSIIIHRVGQIINGSDIYLDEKTIKRIGNDPVNIATEEFKTGKLSGKIGISRQKKRMLNW